MFKNLIFILALFLCFNSYSLPVSYVKGSFRASNQMDKIFFVSTEVQSLTPQEITYADIWLKQRLKGSKFHYNNLSISFNVMPEVSQIVKGCFFSWFKKIDLNSRLNLIEHLKPNGIYNLTQDEIISLSNDLTNFTSINMANCKNDNFLGDITTSFIINDLEQYLIDKANNIISYPKYNDILDKSFETQSKKMGNESINEFLNWFDSTQIRYPYLTSEIINTFLNNLSKTKQKYFNETETSYLLIESINSNVDTFKESISDHYKMIPYMKSTRLIYEKCFHNSYFLEDKCSQDNIQNNFVVVKLKRKNKTLNHLVWVGYE
ncbi:hypothetical protein [Silvanigrella sp.]|jgi:hypothetical protein|uniref:hypothetical protein n=1 Tax=Silvanigrella sp. TaxID=2024976 RepID=UPI0037CA6F2F